MKSNSSCIPIVCMTPKDSIKYNAIHMYENDITYLSLNNESFNAHELAINHSCKKFYYQMSVFEIIVQFTPFLIIIQI